MSRLEDLGWTPPLAAALGRLDASDLVGGRVVEEQKGIFHVATEGGDLPATLAGRLRHAASGREELPAVGDWVALRVESGLASIRHVLPRTSALTRRAAGNRTEAQVVAANVDVFFFVLAIDRPLRPGTVERALALVRDSGAAPVLVLNKADLGADPAADAAAAVEAAPGVPVHITTGSNGSGVEALRPYLGRGRTGAFFGPSGVGKSTLVNCLVGASAQETGDVRESDRRGRHTTTARQLILLPAGGMLIDTPGMRELGVWDAEAGIEAVFADLEALARQCAFGDCGHGVEPGCAVRLAIEQGTIDERRLGSWRKLTSELGRVQRRVEGRARLEQTRRARQRLKALRERAEKAE